MMISFDGKIRVKFGEDANGTYIEISDNGVGMSSLVMTKSLLDFGQSFWGTKFLCIRSFLCWKQKVTVQQESME